jgi:hypothetical protein
MKSNQEKGKKTNLVKVRVNHVFASVFPDKKERIVQLNQT